MSATPQMNEFNIEDLTFAILLTVAFCFLVSGENSTDEDQRKSKHNMHRVRTDLKFTVLQEYNTK